MTATDERVDATPRLVMVAIDAIDFDPENRPLSDQSIADLVPSITEVGVLEPVIVVELEGDRFGLIDGERRTRASLAAGLNEVPAVVRDDLQDRRRFVEASTVANLEREDLHPLDAARRFAALKDVGHTDRSIEQLLAGSWSHSTVNKRLAVLGAIEQLNSVSGNLVGIAVEQGYRAGWFTVRQAETLASLVGELLEDKPEGWQIDDDTEGVIRYVLEIGEAEHRRGELDRELPKLIEAAKHARAVRAARADLAAQGVRDVTDDGMEPGWSFLTFFGSGFDKDAHAHEPCHAAFVTSYGQVRPICTDPDRHDVVDDEPRDDADDEDDRFRTQDEIAEDERRAADESAAKGTRKVSNEEQAAAAARLAERRAIDESRDARPERDEALRALMQATRSKTFAVGMLVRQLAADDSSWIVETARAGQFFDPLDLTGMSDADAEHAVARYVDEDPNGVTRFAFVTAFTLGEEQLTTVVRRRAAGHEVSALSVDAARRHLTELVRYGYKPTDAEAAVLAGVEPAAVVDVTADDEASPDAAASAREAEPEPADDVPEHRFVGDDEGPCDACGHPRAVDAHYDVDGNPITTDTAPQPAPEPEPAPAPVVDQSPIAVAWDVFVQARSALVKAPKSGKRRAEIVATFETARGELAAALVADHPDVFELTAGIVVALESFRGDAATAAETRAALLALLEQAGPLPESFVAAVRTQDELNPATKPQGAPGTALLLYAEEVLAAAEARG